MALCENPSGCPNRASYWVWIYGPRNYEVAACHNCLLESYTEMDKMGGLPDGLGHHYREIGDPSKMDHWYHYDDKTSNLEAIREECRRLLIDNRFGKRESTIHFHKFGEQCQGHEHEQHLFKGE